MRDRFAALGARLEDAWAAAHREEEAFPDVAEEVLAGFDLAFDREAFLDDALDPAAPQLAQLAPVGVFGQPGFTVFHGDGFVVDVYYWLDSLSAIHNHPFCGVFTVLEGFSVHAEYAFEETRRFSERVRLGPIRLRALSVVEAGERRRFSLARHPLVHALVHVPKPSLSMVVRTVRTEGYLRYLPPSLVLPIDAPNDRVSRQLAMLESLRQAHDPRFPERALAFLGRADLEAGFRALTPMWPDCDEDDRRTLLDALRPRHGDAVDAIAPALEHATRTQAADQLRRAMTASEDRLVATALMLAEDRAQVLSLVGARADDPVEALHRFFDDHALFGSEVDQVVGHALVDGLAPPAIAARLRERLGPDAAIDEAALGVIDPSSPMWALRAPTR